MRPNGPYEVSGELPITPKRVVATEQGEPLTWATGDRLSHDSPTLLCRCGKSNNKPFCDDSHLTADFEGTEAASTELFARRHKTYEGTGLKIQRVGSLCAHAGFCGNNATDWFQMLPDTGDTNTRTQMIGITEHCPSGALVCEIDGKIIEPDLPRAVSPVENGPLWVTGNVTILRSDGIALETRNRVALCRCGHSKNKPFCDGTHTEIGFEAKNPSRVAREIPAPTTPKGTVPGVYERIVVGVCESTREESFRVTAMVARGASSQVLVVHAAAEGTESDRVLSGALDLAEKAGVRSDRLTAEPRTGNAPAALAQAVEDADAGLMIIGRGGDRLAGLPRRVLHRAPCDMLVVATRGTGRRDHYRRVLIATDGSATADRAAGRGYELARALDGSVDLVFVGHPATGELIMADTIAACGDDVATETWLLRGNAVKRILETAEAIDADLIVVGNKGLSRPTKLSRTSVPGGVLKGARRDVLLCRTVHQLVSELKPGDGGVIERHGEQLAAFVDESGELHLASARCPHLGCVVQWSPTDNTFSCPCHGSTFSPLGEVVEGPATKPLGPL